MEEHDDHARFSEVRLCSKLATAAVSWRLLGGGRPPGRRTTATPRPRTQGGVEGVGHKVPGALGGVGGRVVRYDRDDQAAHVRGGHAADLLAHVHPPYPQLPLWPLSLPAGSASEESGLNRDTPCPAGRRPADRRPQQRQDPTA